MSTLTTRQRDILRIILDEEKPVSSVELASMLNITPRQVNYSIQGVKVWLSQHHQDLKTIPGAGFTVEILPEQARVLNQEITVQSDVQIILSVSQRQQLLALFLLAQFEPIILSQIEQKTLVSRMTITKDLNEIETWLNILSITLVRKPHFGIQICGTEQKIQQALAEVLWGETPFSTDRIVQISHADGLVFTLERDARRMPLVEYTKQLLEQLNIRRTIGLVAKAEEQLGGRFTDDAVLYLALTFALSSKRVHDGFHFSFDDELLQWLQPLPIWSVASFIARRLGRDTNSIWKADDTAWIAIQMMAAPRNEILPGEIELYDDFASLTERMLDYISQVFEISKLKHDRTLQNGLLTYVVPACYRQRFNIWFPASLTTGTLPEQDERETVIINAIVQMVSDHMGIDLPCSEIDNLVVLLRAAIIRNRTYRFERIFVVCPSGMATAQLLVARLNARFPYLNNLEVISLRDLTPALVSSADLILTTVPLPRQFASRSNVLLVHPLLMPADIEAITGFLS